MEQRFYMWHISTMRFQVVLNFCEYFFSLSLKGPNVSDLIILQSDTTESFLIHTLVSGCGFVSLARLLPTGFELTLNQNGPHSMNTWPLHLQIRNSPLKMTLFPKSQNNNNKKQSKYSQTRKWLNKYFTSHFWNVFAFIQ